MAGAGFKTFNTGDVLTAADVNTYLMQQTVMVFADSAARTTALGANVSEGMLSYLKDTNQVEVYNGSSWVASDDPNAIQNTILDAKGDLISATAADTPARLAVGADGLFLSADSTTATGLKWAAATPASWSAIQTSAFALDKYPYAIAYTGSYYLAGGEDGTLATSSDGTTWTARTFGAASTIYTFAFGASIYVAGNSSGVRTATDPTSTWTNRTVSINGNAVKKIIFDGTQFIAVGGNTVSGNKISTSTNGTTWTARLTSAKQYNDVAYDGVGNYLAVAGDGSNRTLASSTDGTTWTETTAASEGDVYGVVWNGSDFVVVGVDSDESRVRIYTVTTAGVVTEKAILVLSSETAADFSLGASISYFDNKYYIFTQRGVYVGGSDFRFTLVPSGFQNRSLNYPQSLAYQSNYYYGVGTVGTLMRGSGVGA